MADGGAGGPDALVVDCDSHVMEPADLWLRYLEPEFRDRAIRVERREGVEHLVIGEVSVLQGSLAALGGAHLDRVSAFGRRPAYADGCEPASWDPAARAAMLDDWKVDVGVLFPTIGLLPFPTEDARSRLGLLPRLQPLAEGLLARRPRARGADRGGQLARRGERRAASCAPASMRAFAACSCRRR